MRIFIPAVLMTALLGLTGCEPEGPASDIGDNIDQVLDNAVSSSEPQQVETPAPASSPEPEVIEQQKEEIEHVVEEASQEAQQRLDEILENTLEQP
ncbi:hypothetical protein GCM10022421_04090 [Oceanisphaera sediminis]|uniref:Secreted protein n=1 Tax=Oceanisphaera sediminis TaxID=981381 RepID=A0ABP7D8V7_9GAMM